MNREPSKSKFVRVVTSIPALIVIGFLAVAVVLVVLRDPDRVSEITLTRLRDYAADGQVRTATLTHRTWPSAA